MSTTRSIISNNLRANNIATQVAMHTGASHKQRLPETIAHLNEEATFGFNAGLFTLLSNIKGIASAIASTAQYLFPIAFALKAMDLFTYAWRYIKSSNKNAGKTNNLILKMITTAMVGMVVFGGAILGTTASPLVFAAVMAIDVAVSLGKSFYFGYAAYKKPKHARNFYLNKVKENVVKTIAGSILLSALVVTLVYGSPAIAAGVVAGMGMAAAVTLIGLGVLEVVKWVKAKQAANVLRKEIDDSQSKSAFKLQNIKARRRISAVSIQHTKQMTPFTLAKQGFFSNHIALLKPISSHYAAELKALKAAIHTHSQQIKTQINLAKDNFIEKNIWSEGTKRSSKLQALQFLDDIVNNMQEIINQIKNAKPITINGLVFDNYHHVDDLIKKIDQHVTSHYRSAYQSFFADIGGVEGLFKQTYKLLTATVVNGMAHVDALKPTRVR